MSDGGDRDLADELVHVEAAVNNCGLCHREAYLQDMHKSREDGGIQQVPRVVVPRTRPHTGEEGGRAK